MIDYQTYHRIHHLHGKSGLSAVQIAQELDLHPETVRHWLACERYVPRKEGERESKLEPYKAQIMRLLGEHAYTAQQIHQRLLLLGYTGSYSGVKRYVHQVRPQPVRPSLKLVFEPGECVQWDWADCGKLQVGNTSRRLYGFVMVMCHSRMMYVQFTLSHSQEHLLTCQRQGYEFMGGVASTVMCDNDKCAIQHHDRHGVVLLNPRYRDFIHHYGLEDEDVHACTPRCPEQKGRVENGVHYLRVNFLPGRTFMSLAEANTSVRLWMDTTANVRVHATTRRRPAHRGFSLDSFSPVR